MPETVEALFDEGLFDDALFDCEDRVDTDKLLFDDKLFDPLLFDTGGGYCEVSEVKAILRKALYDSSSDIEISTCILDVDEAIKSELRQKSIALPVSNTLLSKASKFLSAYEFRHRSATTDSDYPIDASIYQKTGREALDLFIAENISYSSGNLPIAIGETE